MCVCVCVCECVWGGGSREPDQNTIHEEIINYWSINTNSLEGKIFTIRDEIMITLHTKTARPSTIKLHERRQHNL
jgi:hypothetical protein